MVEVASSDSLFCSGPIFRIESMCWEALYSYKEIFFYLLVPRTSEYRSFAVSAYFLMDVAYRLINMFICRTVFC